MHLKVAKREPGLDIVKVCNLFPTVHSLYGGIPWPVKIFMLPILRNLFGLIMHLIPTFLKQWALSWRKDLTKELCSAIARHMLTYNFLQNAFYMAFRESLEITDFNRELVGSHVDGKLYFLYGRTDPYTPLSFYEDMKKHVDEGSFFFSLFFFPFSFSFPFYFFFFLFSFPFFFPFVVLFMLIHFFFCHLYQMKYIWQMMACCMHSC